jgi:uncharacterized membrane protein
MPQSAPDSTPCLICTERFPRPGMVARGALRHAIAERVRQEHPEVGPDDYLCGRCHARLRSEYVRTLMEDERTDLTALDEQVIKALRDEELLAANVNTAFSDRLTVGQRVADRVAAFGGSWTFILLFGAIIAAWIGGNAGLLLSRPFDPYPFILLNLVLSTLAALQAPVIMMSQNRQAARDRLEAEHDYRINLKAELEIRLLHSKLDQLLTHQWQRLLEIQQLQMDLMEELGDRRGPVS